MICFLLLFFFFFQNCNFVKKHIFTQILRFFIIVFLVVSFALMCKFGNKNVLNTVEFLVEFFLIFQFSVITKNGNFQFFLKFPQHFLVSSHTQSDSFRLCKFRKVGLKFNSQNVT